MLNNQLPVVATSGGLGESVWVFHWKPVAVIVLEAYSNELGALLPLVHNLEQALGRLQPCTFMRVGA